MYRKQNHLRHTRALRQKLGASWQRGKRFQTIDIVRPPKRSRTQDATLKDAA